jgi:putative CocE/NonD family hydrolase
VWITLSDGCRLAARLWLPRDAAPRSVPAILEYLPYRRRDRHRGDDAVTHPYFAARGYAALRVDMRGSGDSDGVMEDEYTPREWADAAEVIAWLAAQPWCNGAVGLIGLSWSGFNGLQIAALAPPALKAVITTCASDDRYADDMHYMGGCLLNDNLQYGSTLFTWLATPPDPAVVGERWREMWLARLEKVYPPAARWMAHQDRDAYWRSGSVCEDFGRIKAAVLAVGGWADGYVSAALRLMAGLPGPRKALIGPWGHAFPHVARPGPAIDFLAYATRWWDQWLKGVDTGIMDEPMVTAWLQASEPPAVQPETRRGRWVAERTWPSPAIRPLRRHLGPAALVEAPAAIAMPVASPATTGTASGEWCPYGWGPDMPTDQREDDGVSLLFDGPPLDRPLAILGTTRLELELAADRPQAMLAARLCDVSPDGVSRRITYGLLDLCHREGFDRAVPLEPGRRYRVIIRFKHAGYEIPAGHRLRLALSTAYWPLAWPSPQPVCLTIFGGALELPERVAPTPEPAPPPLGVPDVPPALAGRVLTPPARGRLGLTRDLATGRTEMRVVRNLGAVHIEDVDLELQALGTELYSTFPDDPAASRSETTRRAGFRRGDWQASVETRSVLTATERAFRLEAALEAREGEQLVFERRWDIEIPRAGAPRSDER